MGEDVAHPFDLRLVVPVGTRREDVASDEVADVHALDDACERLDIDLLADGAGVLHALQPAGQRLAHVHLPQRADRRAQLVVLDDLHQQGAGERRVLARDREPRGAEAAIPLLEIRVLLLQQRLERLPRAVEPVAKQRGKQHALDEVALGGEVAEQRLLGDAGELRDLRGGRAVDPALAEQFHGGVDDRLLLFGRGRQETLVFLLQITQRQAHSFFGHAGSPRGSSPGANI